MSTTIEAFAELGRLFRLEFAEGAIIAVTDPGILDSLRDEVLEPKTGALDRLFGVTLTGDTFAGNATQRIALKQFQTYEFEFNVETGRIRYRLTDADKVTRFAETDKNWLDALDYAAKTSSKSSKAGKKLNCKPGNTQCGGKCQDGNKNCWAGMSPAEKKAAQAAAKKAKALAAKGGASTQPAPPPAASATASASAAPGSGSKIPAGFPSDVGKLQAVKPLGGSTGAMLVKDPDTGKQYVLKYGSGEEHLRSEFATDQAYEALGIKVPKGGLYETEKGPAKLTEFIEGKPISEATQQELLLKPMNLLQKAEQGFAADALLGNWDVVGLSKDNMLYTPDGDVYRVDNGGSLNFRAQGAKKTPEQWDEYPMELWSMRDPKINQSASDMFKAVSLREALSGVPDIVSKKKELLEALPESQRAIVEKRLGHMEKLHELHNELDKSGVYSVDEIDNYLKTAMLDMKKGVASNLPSADEAESGLFLMTLTNAKTSQSSGLTLDDLLKEDDDLSELLSSIATYGPGSSTKLSPGEVKKAVGANPAKGIKPQALTADELAEIDKHFDGPNGDRSATFSGFDNRITNWKYKMSQPDWKAPPPPPSASEMAAVEYYTSNNFGKMNHLLRGKITKDDPPKGGMNWTLELSPNDRADAASVRKAKADALRVTRLANSALAQLPDYQGTVYRGTTLPPDVINRYVPGKTVTERAFVSTSRKEEKAFDGNVKFVIQSKRGALIEDFSYYKKESEVLLAANSRFKVISNGVDQNGVTIIRMTEV